MQDFSRVYQMLDYVEKYEGPFNYISPHYCLFGIGRQSASLLFHLLHPFGNGGDRDYRKWLGLTRDQHFQLYNQLCSTITLIPERSEELKHGIKIDDKFNCIKAAREILAHWEMEQAVDKSQKKAVILEQGVRELTQSIQNANIVFSVYED